MIHITDMNSISIFKMMKKYSVINNKRTFQRRCILTIPNIQVVR
jgi:hypothetical protein